ncbi:hypothetical protein SAMN06265373_102248 [Shimia sagamensis]|uniref:Uncharacterized protein n=1 Tax=Shimia sagamensis TaxID=1566352 RepID=A0ABY1NJV3_9RHOB|nr:hypothetical protein SAMN06265373_102248 [Shimia sagamensis]
MCLYRDCFAEVHIWGVQCVAFMNATDGAFF